MSDPAEAFARARAAGGVVVFGADTVYGLACDPDNPAAVARLFALKGRREDKPAALMFFDLASALAAVGDLGPRTRGALARVLPGPVTLVLPTLGLRVPALPPGSPLARVQGPVLQSSANLAGGPEARRLADVPTTIRAGADLVLDAGELPGIASTVVDLRRYEPGGEWTLLRPGAVAAASLAALL